MKLGGFAWELDLWAPYDVPHMPSKCEEQYMQYSLGPRGEGLILPKVKCMWWLLYYFYKLDGPRYKVDGPRYKLECTAYILQGEA